MPAVDADVIFVTEGRDREINVRCAIRARLSFGVFDRPARIAVLLPQLGRLACPRCRDAAFFDVTLLAIVIALLGRGDDRGIDDLAAHRQKAGHCQRRIKALEHNLDRPLARDFGPHQRFAEGPDRIGVGHGVGQSQTVKPHERQPVPDQIFGCARPTDCGWPAE
jgi:hypothetical protein